MDWNWFFSNIVGGILYDLAKWIAGPLIATIAVTAVARRALGLLKETKQEFTFALGVFVLTIVLFVFLSPNRPKPDLDAGIQETMTGSPDPKDFIAVFTINIINKGQMPTITKAWQVTATVSGTDYTPIFPQWNNNFTFGDIPQTSQNQPLSMTFHKEDNIIIKALNPIQVGGMTTGVLLVDFQNVDPTVFKGIVDYTIKFEDVLSRQYTLTTRTTGQIGTIVNVPGLHTDMVCPVPKGVSASISSPPATVGPFSPAKQLLPPY